jgi:hypothetical protein
MPASWRICIQLPRAPEVTMMLMAFSEANDARMASSTALVASVQMSMSSSRRSPSEMTPRAKLRSTFSALASKPSRMLALVGGAMTSSNETVTPDRVAQWKPISFSASSVAATWIFG